MKDIYERDATLRDFEDHVFLATLVSRLYEHLNEIRALGSDTDATKALHIGIRAHAEQAGKEPRVILMPFEVIEEMQHQYAARGNYGLIDYNYDLNSNYRQIFPTYRGYHLVGSYCNDAFITDVGALKIHSEYGPIPVYLERIVYIKINYDKHDSGLA